METIKNILKSKEISSSILFVVLMILIIRVGYLITCPGVNSETVNNWWTYSSSSALGFINTLTGNGLSSVSIFSLSITPVVTASIFIELVSFLIPKLKELKTSDDANDKDKYQNINKIAAIVISYLSALCTSIALYYSDVILSCPNVFLVAFAMGTGCIILMFIGNLISAKGIGSGISIILFANIISGIPSSISSIYNSLIIGKELYIVIPVVLITLALVFAMVLFTVYLCRGQRRVPIKYSGRVTGRKLRGGNGSVMPFNVNIAGVIPVIIASSLLAVIGLVGKLTGLNIEEPTSVGGHIVKALQSSSWFNLEAPLYTLGIFVYIGITWFFACLYTAMNIDPYKIDKQLKDAGGGIPGIRSGKPTTDYLGNVLDKLINIGTVGLLIVAIIPMIISGLTGIDNLCFFGTSIIIIVGVLSDCLSRIDAKLTTNNYKSFLKD